MRNANRQLPHRFMFAMVIFIAVDVAQAASEEPAGTQAAPVPTVEAMAAALTGQQVYNNICIACHAPPGVGGAPSLGDVNAWAPRIATGMETLINHALNGFTGSTGVMPKKGERLDLSDEEIIRAVEYMVGQVDQ